MDNEITEKEAFYLAEIKSINEHLKTLEDILKMDLKSFDGKVLNIRFSKAINQSIKDGVIKLYSQNSTEYFGKKDKNGYQQVIYSSFNRSIEISIITENKRIKLEETLKAIERKLITLKADKKEYQYKFDNYNKNTNILDDIAKKINKLVEGLTYEDREYLKNKHYIKV